MIDRLSILALKILYMRLQTRRTDAGREHIEICLAKLARLEEQRRDLGTCLDRLLAECAAGSAYFKVYRQFKTYNDPTLNPYLYGGKQSVRQRGSKERHSEGAARRILSWLCRHAAAVDTRAARSASRCRDINSQLSFA